MNAEDNKRKHPVRDLTLAALKRIPTVKTGTTSSNSAAVREGTSEADELFDLYRRTKNIGPYQDLEEVMDLKNVRIVLKEAGIGMDGIKNKINRDTDLIVRDVFGYTDGKTITLYPDAFTNKETLIKTLGHERMHVYQVSTFGKPTNSIMLQEYEIVASLSEDDFWSAYSHSIGG